MTNEELQNIILTIEGTLGFEDETTTDFSIAGVRGTYYYMESEYECDDISASITLKINEIRYEYAKTGYKNFSYDSWVDTTWYDWEKA